MHSEEAAVAAAIGADLAATHGRERPVVEYVYAAAVLDEDGVISTQWGGIEGTPVYRLRGLLDEAKDQLRST